MFPLLRAMTARISRDKLDSQAPETACADGSASGNVHSQLVCRWLCDTVTGLAWFVCEAQGW